MNPGEMSPWLETTILVLGLAGAGMSLWSLYGLGRAKKEGSLRVLSRVRVDSYRKTDKDYPGMLYHGLVDGSETKNYR